MIERLLKRARQEGAQAELYVNRVRSLSIRLAGAGVDSHRAASSQGVALRVIRDGRLGFAYTSDLTPEGLDALMTMALRNASYTTRDDCYAFPDGAIALPDGGEYLNPRFEETREDEKLAAMISALRAARAAGPAVKGVNRLVYGDTWEEVEIANTNGLHGRYVTTNSFSWMETLADDGRDMGTGYSFGYGRCLNDISFEEMGRESATRALELLGGRPIPSKRMSVVFDPFAAVSMIKMFTSMLKADSIAKERSLFSGKLGEQVASPLVTLVDDAVRPDGLNSRPFDDEGTLSRITPLLVEGRLVGQLHNTSSARREGVSSTGHAKRDGIRGIPDIGATNLLIQPGTETAQEICQRVGDGLYVTMVQGAHTVNPLNGTYSLGVAGRRIENGELGAPVRQMTIAGGILDFLQGIVGVGNDLRWVPGVDVVGSPTLAVAGIVASGVSLV